MDRLDAWSEFENHELDYLSKDRLLRLINNLPFAKDTKDQFSSLVEETLFESHTTFLQVPLLAVIMVLTFSDVGRISNSTQEFFEDAFNAVWQRHDSKKQGYERNRYTGLTRSEFIKLLCAFSMCSYLEQSFDFTQDQIEAYLQRANAITSNEVKTSDFVKDLTISTSLMVKDGRNYRFIHRLFQEYFAARFICSTSTRNAKKILDTIWDRQETDAALAISLEIDSQKIESIAIIDRLRNILKRMPMLSDQPSGDFDGYHMFCETDLTSKIIRNLYDFSPNMDDIQVIAQMSTDFVRSYDGSFESIGDTVVSSPELIAALCQDRQNFSSLLDRLEKNSLVGDLQIENLLFSGSD